MYLLHQVFNWIFLIFRTVCACFGVVVFALLGFVIHQYMMDSASMKEVVELKEQIDGVKRMYEEAYTQQKSELVKASSDQSVNYTEEVLTLIESLRKQINLTRNSNLMNLSYELVEIELMKDEFQKQLKWTEEKIKVVETDTRKAIDSVESAVGKLIDGSKSDFEDFRELFDELRVTVDKNQEMNFNSMKHIEQQLSAETSEVRKRMSAFESELDFVKNELDALGIDFTKRVLPNLFNKGEKVFFLFFM